jgi:hypothetical protein
VNAAGQSRSTKRRVDVEIFELPGLDWSAVNAVQERTLAECLAGWQERYPDVTVQGSGS